MDETEMSYCTKPYFMVMKQIGHIYNQETLAVSKTTLE